MKMKEQKFLKTKKILKKDGHKCLIFEGGLSSLNDFDQIDRNEYKGLSNPIKKLIKKFINN